LWFWSRDCHDGVVMGIRITVEGQIVYRSTFRACRILNNEPNKYDEKGMREFYFPGGHTFQGEYHTTNREKIEGDIWEAGADPADILLGVTFSTRRRELLNSVYIVKPGETSKSVLDPIFVITTHPIKK
jgi:hypothetical protein